MLVRLSLNVTSELCRWTMLLMRSPDVDSENAALPSLWRLYFGKVINASPPTDRPSRFFNSPNFPLDVSRYRKILETVEGTRSANLAFFSTVDEIAKGMGEMLGCIYWLGGYDGRDIEFVMGGANFSGITMAVIDFNQVHRRVVLFFSMSVLITVCFFRCVRGRGQGKKFISLSRRSSSMIPLYQTSRQVYLESYPHETQGAC
ncbi:hypothetical protein CPB84DRAFT_1960881 [Gymnopilus junonius]|uniref:Uncharacterized protein n=1 Tax=Gymnopilus junonius TaxID=109634 RepID=A0A9P5NSR1_GYMJU|nr:hypothetical protein CPB84DRAFT_1960881 [Gymnopilus junonius]